MSYREENDRIAKEKIYDAAVVYFRVLNWQRLGEKPDNESDVSVDSRHFAIN